MTKEEREVYEYINSIEKWCQLCGSTYQLHRHHIRYGGLDGGRLTYIGNIIVLCESCHKKVHSNKKYWKPKLIELDEEIRSAYENDKKTV